MPKAVLLSTSLAVATVAVQPQCTGDGWSFRVTNHPASYRADRPKEYRSRYGAEPCVERTLMSICGEWDN